MKITRFKLYHYPASRSARVKWMLHEVLGDKFDVEIVRLYDGEQYAPDYVALNPNHNVPMLKLTMEDGSATYMLESGAMITFLADAFPDKALAPPLGELSAGRADYLHMLHFGTASMDMMLWQIRMHEHLLPPDECDAATIARYRNKFADEVEPQLLQRLERTDFICGEDFCAADCVIAHNVGWARRYELCQARTFGAYLSRVAKRPAFRMAFADAHEFSTGVAGQGATGGKVHWIVVVSCIGMADDHYHVDFELS